MTTVRDRACFGLYADGKGLADVGVVAAALERVDRRAGGGEPAMSGGVLLTGATGFVGMELLCRYLERGDRHVYALVRAGDAAEADARLGDADRERLRRWGRPP